MKIKLPKQYYASLDLETFRNITKKGEIIQLLLSFKIKHYIDIGGIEAQKSEIKSDLEILSYYSSEEQLQQFLQEHNIPIDAFPNLSIFLSKDMYVLGEGKNISNVVDILLSKRFVYDKSKAISVEGYYQILMKF